MFMGLSVLTLLCLIWLPFALILRPVLPSRRGHKLGCHMISFGCRLYLMFLRLVCASHFDLAVLDQLRAQPPQLLVANHPSRLDAVLILSRLPNTVCVVKAALMRNILLGSAARLAGYISNDGPLEMVLRAEQALEEGAHVLLFPEGSRTSRFPLDLFRHGAALIARRSQVPIRSLLITFNTPYLSKYWPLWRKPQLPLRGVIQMGECFSPSRDVTTLTTTMETAMRHQLATTNMP